MLTLPTTLEWYNLLKTNIDFGFYLDETILYEI